MTRLPGPQDISVVMKYHASQDVPRHGVGHLHPGFCLPLLIWLSLFLALLALASPSSKVLTDSLLLCPGAFSIARDSAFSSV